MCAGAHVPMDRGSREFTAFRTRGRRLPCAGTHAAPPGADPFDPERRSVSWRQGEGEQLRASGGAYSNPVQGGYTNWFVYPTLAPIQITTMGQIRLSKLRRFATLAFQNSIRLHSDSILLFNEGRHQTAFYISVIAMEEMAKAKELEHFCFHSWGDGRADSDFEQKFLLRLFDHKTKQRAFAAREMLHYSPKFLKLIDSKQLDNKKLRALYVGLERNIDKVKIDGKVLTPDTMKPGDAKRQISLINSELREFIKLMDAQDGCFDIEEMDSLLDNSTTRDLVSSWKHRTGLKSRRWWTTYWRKELNSRYQNVSAMVP